jgi:glucokinase
MLVVGVDLGGTQTRAVLANDEGRIISQKTTLTQALEGPNAVLERICEQIELAADGQEFAAIGIGAPGATDPFSGVVIMAPNLPGWRNINLTRTLNARFDVPVFVGNDANLAGLAEHRYGAGQDCSHMIYITVSTGIGGGVIVRNRMLLGRQGLAGEIGHMTIDLSAEERGEVAIGTLEGLASGPNIARRARHALHAGAESSLRQHIGDDIDSLTPELLGEAADGGDAFALEQFAVTGRYLGIGIVNLLHTFNPQRIVLGGGVWMHCRPYMEESMWGTIRARCNASEYWQDLEIVPAALGGQVGLLGAVALAVGGLEDMSTT